MSSLQPHETIVFENIFEKSRGPGYVLQFSDTAFSDFFKAYGIDIEHLKYCANGTSKMKRMRSFWNLESDKTVGAVLDGLIKYAREIDYIDDQAFRKTQKIVNRLLCIKDNNSEQGKNAEQNFLSLESSIVDLLKLDINGQLASVLTQRVTEIERCMISKAPLAIIFLCGSTLEGILLDVATKNSESFNSVNIAPKDKAGKVIPITQWTLNNLIDVSYELKIIDLNVKKFSHVLRDFRNYIHPRVQAIRKFNPDMHTAAICWQVLKVTISNLTRKKSYYSDIL